MKILVPTKRVPYPDQRVRATEDGSRVDDSELYSVPNPFDLIAEHRSERGELKRGTQRASL